MQQRFLFFVAEIGLAHLTESLAIAEELSRRHHQVFFAIPKRKMSLLKLSKSRIKFVDINPLLKKDSTDIVKLIENQQYLLQKTKEDLALIKKFRPDCVVIDYRPSAVSACALLNLPAVYITISAGLPGSCYVPNPELPQWLFKLVNPLFRFLAARYMNKMIGRSATTTALLGKTTTLSALINRMSYIVPEPEGYLPRNNKNLRVHYTGPIFWKGFETHRPAWLEEINRDGNTVYLTFGGTGFDRQKLVLLAKTLIAKDYRVIVSSSTIAKETDFPRLKNLFVAQYLPGLEVCRRVDLVLCHGGHGTITQAILAGTPVVTIPFNPDQLLHSLRAAEFGYGVCLWKLTLPQIVKLMRFNWEDYEQHGKNISVSQVLTAVKRVITDKQYRHQAEKFARNLGQHRGAKLAAHVIEHHAFCTSTQSVS